MVEKRLKFFLGILLLVFIVSFGSCFVVAEKYYNEEGILFFNSLKLYTQDGFFFSNEAIRYESEKFTPSIINWTEFREYFNKLDIQDNEVYVLLQFNDNSSEKDLKKLIRDGAYKIEEYSKNSYIYKFPREVLENKTYNFIKWIYFPQMLDKMDNKLVDSLDLNSTLLVKIEFYENYSDKELTKINKYSKFINKDKWKDREIYVLVSPKINFDSIHPIEEIASFNFVKSLELIDVLDVQQIKIYINQSEFYKDKSLFNQPHAVAPWQRDQNKILSMEKEKSPKVVSQKEINSYDLLSKINKDVNFKNTYDYANKIGYINLKDSYSIQYDNSDSATISVLSSIDNRTLYMIKYSRGEQSKTFFIKYEKSNISNEYLITFFGLDPTYNEEWGVTVDSLNMSLVNSWGHNSCAVNTCFWNAVNYFMLDDPLSGIICGTLCDPICIGDYFSSYLISCGPCVACLAGLMGASILGCNYNPCTFYPCYMNCDDNDGWGENWQIYCSGNDVWRKKYFFDYYCTSNKPLEGDCQLDASASGWGQNELYQSCPYGCNNGVCLNSVQCYSDIECGSDRWTGSKYCSGGDVWQDRKEYTCNSPGTTSSSCISSTTAQKREDCGGDGCTDGVCNTPPECNGENEYWCNGACWTFCSTGSILCCPSSGDPHYCYDEANSICKSDGSICSPIPETCNNLDDNCDNTVDSFNESCGLGICSGGTKICSTGSWSNCSTVNLVTNETCNNLDDDCDGNIDENLTQECGINVGICVKGTQTCSVGNWSTCGGSYVGPTNETCNGLDDNCNGIIDEGNICGDYPNGTLVSPAENYTSYTGNITFNCSARDNKKLANITLYHSISGNMSANSTKNITGTSNSSTWTINNIPNSAKFQWNCLVYDNDSHWSWVSNVTRNVFVNITAQPPQVTLISPSNNRSFESYINDVSFNISAQDGARLINCTLYTNTTGTWKANITNNVSGSSNLTNFTIFNISNGKYLWNALCYDNYSKYAWAQNNWTFNINYTGESYCHELNQSNSTYSLKNNISSSGICFNITGNNITIDGQGYTLFYSQSVDGDGIYNLNYNQTTIKNLSIILNRSGISGAKNSAAIHLKNNKNHNITFVNIFTQGQTSGTGKAYGIYLEDSENSSISNVLVNTSNTYRSDGIYFYATTANRRGNTILNSRVYVYGSTSVGLNIYGINNGGIRDVFVENSSFYSKNSHGISIQSGIFGSGDTSIINTTSLSQGTSKYGLYLYGAEDTFVIDSNISSLNSYDVVSNSGNHIFLNVSYFNESITGGNLTRGWYLNITVNNSNGDKIYQANVRGGDIFGSLDFSELTDSNGKISRQQLGEYINNGTKTYYNNYTINVTKSGYTNTSKSINLTGNTNLFITLPNSPPLISSLILNSTLGTNLTTENLTIYAITNDSDGDPVKKIYNWYKDNKSLTSIYLAFDGKSNLTDTQDFSNRNNNGKVYGAIWDATGGYDGFGAYLFNNTGDRLIVANSADISINNNLTILTWVYPKTDTYAITMKDVLDSNYDYRFYSWSGYLRFRWGNGSANGLASCDDCSTDTNKWIFLGIVYKCNNTMSSVDFYVNGVYNKTDNSNVGCVKNGTSDLWIGTRDNLAYTLNGTLDELRIYNYSLSSNQIKAIYENKTNVIVSGETKAGEYYKCEVTPYDSKQTGNSNISSQLLVLSP